MLPKKGGYDLPEKFTEEREMAFISTARAVSSLVTAGSIVLSVGVRSGKYRFWAATYSFFFPFFFREVENCSSSRPWKLS